MMRSSFSLIPTAAVLLAMLATARADTSVTWDGATANWTDASHWSGGVFPNNSGTEFFDAMISGGGATLDQNITINQFTLGGGLLDGGFNLTALEGLQWTAGALRGSGEVSLGNASTTSIAGGDAALLLSTRTVTNGGSALFSAGTIRGGSGATLTNLAGASFTVLAGADFFADTTSPTYAINNLGVFTTRSSAGFGFTTIDAIFTNTGDLRVENSGTSHTLSLAGGGTHSGRVNLQAGSTLELGGATTLQSGASFSGEGLAVVAGNVLVTGGLSAVNVAVAVGELNIGATVFDVSGSAVQTGGVLRIAGGTLRVAGGGGTFTLDDGSLIGAGTLNASLATQGEISPGSTIGTLQITGAASFGEDARLAIDIGGSTPASHDLLSISSTANLGGTLAVTLSNGFTPTFADTFTILTATSAVNGFFANALIDGARFGTADGKGTFAVDYTDNSVVLTQFIPEPSVATMLGFAMPMLPLRRLRSRARD